ncbi:restriction endonuclease subunit S [Luteimonas sp. A482]
MNSGWIERPFEECIEPIKLGAKVQRKDFLEVGDYPVVSQEDAFINGYWNDADDLLRLEHPVVVFGDHTRTLKYVDFDFVLGADGVKVLSPREFLDPKFFYYQMHRARPDSLGYARHYRLLRESCITYPALDEQRRIVTLLDDAFAGIATAKANAEKNLRSAREVFTCELAQRFISNENTRNVAMRDLFDVGSSKRVLKSEWKTSGVPFYRGREVTRLSTCGSVENELFISEKHFAELKSRYGAPDSGDIVITAIGTIGNTHIVRDSDCFYFKDASVLWLKKASDVLSEFVNYWLKSPCFTEQMDKGNGATVDTLTIQKLASVRLDVPPLQQQEYIVRKLDELRGETRQLESVYTRKLAALDELKQSLLHQAFSGQL